MSEIPRRRFLGYLSEGAFLWGLMGIPGMSEVLASELKEGGNPEDERYWKLVRRQFMLAPGLIYLNNGSLGPSPRVVFEANVEYKRLLETNPVHYMWGPLGRKEAEVRRKAAALLEVSEDEVALTRNTTEGMNIVAFGLRLKEGDEVVTTDHEHPGGIGCWFFQQFRRGVKVRQVHLPSPPESKEQIVELFRRAITSKTRVLSVCHVNFTTGMLMPVRELAELARKRGIWVVVDGAHPPGMMKVDLRKLGGDFYASSSHKWLLAPKTVGILYVRKEVQGDLLPLVTHDSGGYDRPNMKKFEAIGTHNVPERLALGTAIDFHNLIGTKRVEARCRYLSDFLKAGLKEIPKVRLLTSEDYELSAPGITSFMVEKGGWDCRSFREEMAKQGIEVKSVFIPEAGLNATRVSTHIYNNLDDVKTFLTALRRSV